jgi:tRNA(Met) cytidine acetyltransferase
LVYDAYGGFDPDSFGAGALRGGGLLLLLTPPLDRWPDLPDPQAVRIAVHPYTPEELTGRFLRRFVRVLREAPGAILVAEGHEIPKPQPRVPPVKRHRSAGLDECRSADQAAAVAAIVATAMGRARRPLILTSDRGRGKSSALGIAAARLLDDGNRRILVTAPRHGAVRPVFAHCARLLPQAKVLPGKIERGAGTLEFMAPDALAAGRLEAELLLVDEAAGIPAPLLESLLRQHPRVVFATTVHGYEGTGRGFEIRFRGTLNRLAAGWREIVLQTPIRWAAGDPLESLVGRALSLDANPAPQDALAGVDPADCRFELLDRDSLLEDEPALSQIFGLLVLAHYQSRPMDLRHLLDGPNIEVYALRYGPQVAATALVAVEGQLDSELAQAVFEGRRRPRGHLLAQTLSAHAGLESAPRLRFARIVRIAVHPAVQGRGLGRRLLEEILASGGRTGTDLVGASFGATVDLLRFWERCGFALAHVGTSRNATSGAHAAVLLRSLTPEGDELEWLARGLLRERLPVLLAGPLRRLEPAVVARALQSLPPGVPSLGAREQRELEAFALALRPYESSLPVLVELIRHRLGPALGQALMTRAERDALIAGVLQHRDWGAIAGLTGVSGRAELIRLLRVAAGKLLGPHRSHESGSGA